MITTQRCFVVSAIVFSCLLSFLGLPGFSASSAQDSPREYGPYHGSFLPGGIGLKKPLNPQGAPLSGTAPWSMYCWVRSADQYPSRTLLAGFGESASEAGTQRYLALIAGRPAFWAGGDSLMAGTPLEPSRWIMLCAVFDGATLRLYQDGTEVAAQQVELKTAAPAIQLAPQPLPWSDGEHFGGKIAYFTLINQALDREQVRALLSPPVPLDVLPFESGSKTWPVSTRATLGLRTQQDPSTLPKPTDPKSLLTPVVNPRPTQNSGQSSLSTRAPNQWALLDGWRLAEAPRVTADGRAISRPGFPVENWFSATVPGTVLTTLIDQGVYPDPDYGLNNLLIPESLSRQDYWYRTEFATPATGSSKRFALTFEGVNYAAEVWLNGKRLGDMAGAFIRGSFDVTGALVPGKWNALAVRISPPPHPGIPHEQSVKAGAGLNGGMLCLDGPTFICTEGWDWLPGIRDRNAGIWQDVVLSASGAVKIGDVQVITALPLPDTRHARVTLNVPLHNDSPAQLSGTLEAAAEGFRISKRLIVPSGDTLISLSPDEFPQLMLSNPRLWWPNGYGNPELYHLKMTFSDAQGESDAKSLRFGIRELTYEMTLFDKQGRLRRVEFDPTTAKGAPVVDVRYEAALESPGGYVYSLRPGAESSPAIRQSDDWRASPNLIIRVNGVRIACKGGNWGLDDARKRVSRDRLEPYVRLHRDAHLTMIRNWCGQSTEEALYDLCDEYGLLIWNDFWITTQDSNLDPSDTALFLANARDTLLRFRNHPSVALWCGRNEGVPMPAINDGLDSLIRTLDGTRCYLPNSRLINLAPSGPWNHGEAVEFFTTRALGFSTELGLPSPPTLEAFRAMMPAADLWPPNDTWAYHDWHADGGGRVAPFMASMEQQLGPPGNLQDFMRKAQLFNFVNHRAMFEGFNAHLWAPNSGRLLWMSQPAWPSMSWQLFSHDYDTHATYYGVKKACEPVHVQLNLPDLGIMVINNTTGSLDDLTVSAQVFSFEAKPVSVKKYSISVGPNSISTPQPNELPKNLPAGILFIKLELRDNKGELLSENFYWHAAQPDLYRKLAELAEARLEISALQQPIGAQVRVSVDLKNPGSSVALMTKVLLRHADAGARVLPAYASDNYVTLLPGETRRITIDCPANAVQGPLQIAVEGWNTHPVTVPCRPGFKSLGR